MLYYNKQTKNKEYKIQNPKQDAPRELRKKKKKDFFKKY